jgi:hypothetical protein
MAQGKLASSQGVERHVRCPECLADVPSLRDFCPQCGTPTDSGLHGRDPGRRSPDELKRNRKTVLIACAAIAGLLAVAGRLSWPIPPIHIGLHEPHKGPVVTSAEALARAYTQDPAAAARRFDEREIMVSGEFLRIVPDGYGSIDIRLKAADPNFPLGVDVVSASVDDAKRLRPGQQVTVSCRSVAGSGNDRWLKDCAIQPTSDEGAAAGVDQAQEKGAKTPVPPPDRS